ncbi:MAG: amino acid ABC transporter permease [Rhodoferax sp.]
MGADSSTASLRQQHPQVWRRCLGLHWLDLALCLLVAIAVSYLIWRVNAVFRYNWNWAAVWPFVLRLDLSTGQWVPNLIVEGLLTTLRLAFWGIVLAGSIGGVMGIARNSKRPLFRWLSGAYVMLIRNTPPVVFIFVFVFFVASQWMHVLAIGERTAHLPPVWQWLITLLFGPIRLIDNFFLGLICLAIFSGAYVTEIVRAGIESVPKSQIEAAQSLGMTKLDVLRFVVLPQAFRNVVPPMAGQFIQLIKDSSLVSLVSIQELTFMAQDVQVSTQRVFEVFVFVGAIYFSICFVLSLVFAGMEKRFSGARS